MPIAKMSNNKLYDTIFIGAGLLPMLEAVHQSRCGKSVLMVEAQEDIGGAWLSRSIFGLHDIENAIHYFLPDKIAPGFMKQVLEWDVIDSPRKYRVFRLPGLGRCKARYDSRLGRLFADLSQLTGFAGLYPAINDALFRPVQKSYYVSGGAPEMLRKIRAILETSNVEIRYRSFVDRIWINTEADRVECSTASGNFVSKKLVLSHGAKIKRIESPIGSFSVEEKLHLRPAAHMLLSDSFDSGMLECIFTGDSIIKYAHDVTRFAREAAELSGKKKLIVLAFYPHTTKSDDLYGLVLEKLKWAGFVSENATLEDANWWDVTLPSIDDDDLDRMKLAFSGQIDVLKTDNFAAGIGYYAERWLKTLAPQSLKTGALPPLGGVQLETSLRKRERRVG